MELGAARTVGGGVEGVGAWGVLLEEAGVVWQATLGRSVTELLRRQLLASVGERPLLRQTQSERGHLPCRGHGARRCRGGVGIGWGG